MKKQPSTDQLKRRTIRSVTSTELEDLAKYYERGRGVVSTFERSAILRGIAAELAERAVEKANLNL